jgi:hypothetical protein
MFLSQLVTILRQVEWMQCRVLVTESKNVLTMEARTMKP